jgi:hypothetical protein
MLSGLVIGYDPGGNGRHGLAELQIEGGAVTQASTHTMKTVEDVIRFLEARPSIAALGVDTLTCWSTGPSGWRPADRWLRVEYEKVQNSITSPNSLFGSMGLNGMAVLMAARQRYPDLLITETHPKVLYYEVSGEKYDYENAKLLMDTFLANRLGVTVVPANEHEWDAALSAFAALEGLAGRWMNDLHRLAAANGERLITPSGETNYYWPE